MAHGFLSYQDTRGEVDYLGGIINAVKKYLDKRDEKEQVADMVAAKINVEDKETAALEAGKSAPRLPVGAQKMLTGGSFSKLAGRNPKALPGAVATNPEVRGGAITRMGFSGKRLKSEGFVGDQIIDVSATPVNDSNQIVQAIDRLTFVSMNLLAATKEQTAVARDQQNFFEKLARKDKAALEESELERRKNVSGNLPYDRSPLASGRLLPPAGGTGGSRRDMGDFLKTAARRGVSANKAGAQAIAKGGRFGAIKLAQMGAKNPLKAYNMMPKIAQNASDLLFGTKRAAPIVKKLTVGAKVGKEAVTAGAAAGKAIKAGVSPSVANKITKKTPPALLKLLAGSEEVDGIRRLSNVAAGADDGANAAKLTSRLLAEGYDKPQVAKIVADQFPNAGKVLSESVTSTATAKLASKTVGKGVGKSILKKIPVIAGLAGIAFGVQRALEGDFLGAGLEIASGVMGATGVGAGASLGIDGFLLARDLGVTPFATGGIITQPTAGLVGEAGTEGVFPLEGSRGKKTFEMFGNAFVDAQKSRIREVAQIQSAGLEEFARKKDSGFFSWLFGGGGNNGNPSSPSNTGNGKAWWDPLGLFTGKNNSNGVQPRAPMVGPPPPLPPITGTDSVSMARSLIVDKEGFEEMPYWDVNAYRAGYGSDTYTLADGTVKKVQQGVPITRADADRDIDRRISTEFMPRARSGVGPDIWDKLPAAAQAALTSIAYNYGSVPERVTRVAKSTNGNIEAIAGAVEGLKGDDGGINAGRRQHEADMIRSSAGQAAASLTPPPAIGDQSSVSPAAAETGNPLSAASQQVATAAFTPQAAPIIQNFYGSDAAKSSGGNMPATVAFGISSRDTGTDPFAEFRIRSLA